MQLLYSSTSSPLHKTFLLLVIALASILLSAAHGRPTDLMKRIERVPDDALDWREVYRWMGEKKLNSDDRFVFYSNQYVGLPMAEAFCSANHGYLNFWMIFGKNENTFAEDFGGADINNAEIAKSCSKAMAVFAQGETRVFNHNGASPNSYWLDIELPQLEKSHRVTEIYTMRDDATDPNDHDGDLLDDGSQSVPKITDDNNPDYIKCHGISGNIYVDFNAAASAIDDFCKQSDPKKEYNQGSLNNLRLSITNYLDNSKLMSSAPNCYDTLLRTINSCDGNDSVNNPRNFKFGSYFSTGDGWVYQMEPLATHTLPQTDADSCDVSYKFFFDEFEIRGRNFDAGLLGDNGSKLLDDLGNCGDITDWGFDLTPHDSDYQWYAHGNLPIGTRSCVGTAVQKAGGSSSGSCTGAG